MAFLLKNIKKIHSRLMEKVMPWKRYGISHNGNCHNHFAVRLNSRALSKSQAQPDIAFQEPSTNHRSVSFSVGDKISGFQVKQVEQIPEFSLVAVKLVHEATKAEYLHIDRDDSNNAFSVMFRTTPTDSTGLPHILEHTTLCGSEKFPCRDPFFKMLNRSLASFMNAMTAPDWTMYPFSTQNSQDYRNLMSVYLDAVFRPLLKETDFNQEGWRLEFSDPKDINSQLMIKGVVFNEMKGVFSDNQNLFELALQNSILPSHTYGVCSGGDPLEIPNLTYPDLKNFHNNYYSPFNAKYYSYGNIPLTEHLKYINDEYLTNMDLTKKGKVSTAVPSEKRWTEPVRKHIKCRVNPLAADKNKQSCIAISQLCCSITDIEEQFVLHILSELLLSGPNSSFYKTLVEPNIGSGFIRATGYERNMKDTIITVGLQEVSEDDFDRIIKIYEETIDDIIENGFDKDHLESILHSLELNTKHQTSGFGLGLIFNIASTWNHGGDIIGLMKIEEKINTVRQKLLADDKYLEKKVRQYLKENKHKLVLTMSPDPNFDAEMKKKEDKILNDKLKGLNEEKRSKIYRDGLKLLEEQKEDNKSCLPTLSVKDLRKDIQVDRYFDKKISNIPFRLIPQPTNGITYFRGILNTKGLSDEEMSLLPLFALISTNMGTKRNNYKDFHQLITLKTGGLNVGYHSINDPKNLNCTEDSLAVSSYCLNKNLGSMFDLWLELFHEMELSDVNRFETLAKSEAADLVNGIVRMGHSYAAMSSGSLVSSVIRRKEERGGMTYVNRMKDIVLAPPEELLEKMKRIAVGVTNRSEMRFAANIMEGTDGSVLEEAGRFLGKVPAAPGAGGNFEELQPHRQHYGGIYHVLPINVNFASKTVMAVPYEHEDFAPLRVLSRLLTMKFLHPEIREKAGAYGSGLNVSQSGALSFFSYSDPNPSNSLKVFDESLSWLTTGKNITEEDVDEAKLGVFQTVDAPVAPGDRGMRSFLSGISDEAYRQHRLRLMSVSLDQLIQVGVKYLDETNNKLPVGRSVIGQKNESIIKNSSYKWKVLEAQ